MRKFILISLVATSVAFAQAGRATSLPDKGAELSYRMASSDHIVTGVVTRLEAVQMRSRKAGELTLDNSLGRLYTITVDAELCGGADFDPKQTMPAGKLGGEAFLFLPSGQALPVFDDPNPPETLVQGGRYLLFLNSDPQAPEMTADYDLDATRNYYRATNRKRGAVALPSGDSTYQAVTTVCNAVKPGNVQMKMNALRQVASSADPLTRQTAQAVLRHLEGGTR